MHTDPPPTPPPPPKCPPFFMLGGRYCYKVNEQVLNYYEAENECRVSNQIYMKITYHNGLSLSTKKPYWLNQEILKKKYL